MQICHNFEKNGWGGGEKNYMMMWCIILLHINLGHHISMS